jgi:hypothetical protein
MKRNLRQIQLYAFKDKNAWKFRNEDNDEMPSSQTPHEHATYTNYII